MTLLRRVFVLLGICAITTAGCADSTPEARFAGASDSWRSSLGIIGRAVAFHGTPLQRDADDFYEPLGYAFAHDGQTDFFHSIINEIIVLHGVPPWLDPRRPVSRVRPSWQPEPPIGGTRVYRAIGDPKTALLVRPPSTWIYVNCYLCDGVATNDLVDLANAGEPPALPPPPPGALAASVTLDSIGFELPFTFPYWFRAPSTTTTAGFVVYPRGPTTFARGVLNLGYPDAASANAAAADLQARLRKDPRQRERDMGDSSIGRVGNELFAHFDGVNVNGSVLTVTSPIPNSFDDFLSWAWTGH